MEELHLAQPDDWHTHLRNGAYLATTVEHTAQRFNKAIIMPNLAPTVTTVELAYPANSTINSKVITWIRNRSH